jgi:hypothetical protein
MAEEEKKEAETPNQKSETGGGIDYASLLAKTKKTYEAKISGLEAEYQGQIDKMTQMVIDGQTSEKKEPIVAEKVKSRLELYKEYKENPPCTNMEYWQRQLDLREATIREHGKDPWVNGSYGVPAPGMVVDATKMQAEATAMSNLAETVQSIIDESEGDPAKFNYLFSSAVLY